ncbi:MAG: ATP-binding cassette domain-containing protein, partial [bacterium]
PPPRPPPPPRHSFPPRRSSDLIGLVGPNGAGKSTLLRIVAGALDFDAGERREGHNVQVAFFAQHQLEALHPNMTVLEELECEAKHDDVPRLRGHLGNFLFSGDDVDKKISVLSGGEKARVALAKMLLRPSSLLVLDEPTNHLDIESREVLEDALGNFKGTLVFVSHDRAFINALATRVVEVNHGVLDEYIGNYDDFLQKKTALEKRRVEATKPEKPKAAAAPGQAKAQAKAAPRPKLSKQDRAEQRERKKAHDKAQRQIGRIEEKIQEHEKTLESLGWKQSDPGISSDAAKLQELASERTAVQELISDLYADWERLTDELSALSDGLD